MDDVGGGEREGEIPQATDKSQRGEEKRVEGVQVDCGTTESDRWASLTQVDPIRSGHLTSAAPIRGRGELPYQYQNNQQEPCDVDMTDQHCTQCCLGDIPAGLMMVTIR